MRRSPLVRLSTPLRLLLRVLPLAMLLASALPDAAPAQLSTLVNSASQPQGDRNAPVTFTADTVEYDRENALVIAQGHVEAWQNEHVLRADRVTFDRNTGVAAAKGNVALLEPNGQVLFADYAELSQDMKNGVMRDMRAILAENGRLAANGARRTEGQINEMSRVVYSTCDLCAKDPTKAPLWQIRALSAVQDLENKKIEYQDAVLEMYGVPVGYMPYFWHVDPSVKRGSGLLIPAFGATSHLGAFFSQPYYWVIDDQSDATFVPTLTTRTGLGRVPTPVQQRLAAARRIGRLPGQLAAGHDLFQGAVQPERYLALGIQHRPCVIGGLRARLPSRGIPRQRADLAQQPGVRRRLRPGGLFALRRPVLPDLE